MLPDLPVLPITAATGGGPPPRILGAHPAIMRAAGPATLLRPLHRPLTGVAGVAHAGHAPTSALPLPVFDGTVSFASVGATFIQRAQRVEGATPGCYGLDIDEQVYHTQLEGVSSSALKQMLRSPAHYRAYLSTPNEDTPARVFGRAVHTLVLEPELYAQRYVIWTGGRRVGRAFEAFTAAHPGRKPLTPAEDARIRACAASARSNAQFPVAAWLDGAAASDNAPEFLPARREFTICWTDEETGLHLKARIDAHSPDTVPLAVDLKTTDDARTGEFRHQVFRNHYDLQAAHYLAALRAFYGKDFAYALLPVESCEPFASNFLLLKPSVLANGEAKRRHALGRLRACLDSGQWPAYAYAGPQDLDMPFMGGFVPEN